MSAQRGGEEQDCTQFAVLIQYHDLLFVMKWVIILP